MKTIKTDALLNLSDKNHKITLEELRNRIAHKFGAEKIGHAMYITLKHNEEFVTMKIDLDTSTTAEQYDTIRLSMTHFVTQVKGITANICICDDKYIPASTDRELIKKLYKAGHYWKHDSCFYGYIPNWDLIAADVNKFITINKLTRV